MSCNNCFNGCSGGPTSDKCVMYTGLSYPELGIESGDNLLSVETAIITYLEKALDGTGIVMTIDSQDLCAIVSNFLPVSGDITLVDYISALIQTACSLQEQLTTEKERIDTIEADYTLECLSGVAPGDGTHAIVQAVISHLCTLDAAIEAVVLDLDTNYVKVADLDSYIAAYIEASPTYSAMRSRMVPNTVVEYYGTLANFDGSGAGIDDWEQIYLCNGNNNTPDKRGRSPIGVTTVPGGGAFAPAVDPSNPANPNYSLEATGGSNTVTLVIGQVPAHTHVATVTVTDPGHTHDQTGKVEAGSNEGSSGNDNPINGSYPTSSSTTGISVSVVNAPQGNNEAHANVHPVLACYYIMYIPTP